MNRENEPKKISRREFLRTAGGIGAGMLLAGGAAAGLTYLVLENEKSSGKLNGEYVKEMEAGKYRTDTFGNGEEIPLRREPNQGKQAGIALPNFNVEAQPVYGTFYSSNQENLSVVVDGEKYGIWYKIDEVQIWEKTPGGEYVPIGVVKGAYVSGNFLTRIVDESDNQSDAR